MDAETALIWDQVRDRAGRFPPQAYAFVQHGLRHTVELLFEAEESEASGSDLDEDFGCGRHVSGRDLCMGLRDFALGQYGPLARTVLAHWGIMSTGDFGRIVFTLIDAGLMSKTDDDSMIDFESVFDFCEAFDHRAERC